MALADFQPEQRTILHKGEALVAVRGLTLNELSVLVRAHGPALRQIYDDTKSDTDNVAYGRLALKVLTHHPEVAYHTISLVADPPATQEEAARLTAPLLIRVLVDVFQLTMEDLGGPLAFGALLRDIIASVVVAIPPATP